MKKLLILVFVAAMIGIVISRGRKPSQAPAQAAGQESLPKPATLVRPQSPEELVLTSSATSQWAEAPASADEAPPAPAADAGAPVMAAGDAASAPADPPLLSATTLLPVRAPAPAAAPAPPADLDALVKAREYLKAGKRAEARALLTPLYLQASGPRAAQLRTVLDGISRELVFNPRCTEGAAIHVVAPGEVGVRIARKYGVNWGMIALINGIKMDSVLRVGQKLKVLEGKAGVVVHKDEFRLTLLWNGAYVKEYPIGIGKDESPTPDGQFVVDETLVHPVWTRPDGVLVKYGEAGYALGERWMGFADEPGASGLGIHGTNEENTIGTKCSNGCVRMRNPDVLELYDFVTVGTHVTIEE